MFELASQLTNLANLSLQASSQTWPTFAVGECTKNKSLALPPPLVLQQLCAENGVNCFVLRKESANHSYVGSTIMSHWYSCVLNFLAGLVF
jgi:hypothetical protein